MFCLLVVAELCGRDGVAVVGGGGCFFCGGPLALYFPVDGFCIFNGFGIGTGGVECIDDPGGELFDTAEGHEAGVDGIVEYGLCRDEVVKGCSGSRVFEVEGGNGKWCSSGVIAGTGSAKGD